MLIFGTIGIFVKYIPLTSSTIAMARGYMGAAFLLFVMFLSGKKPSFAAIKKNALALIMSGAAIGVNWIFLFEAYNYTSVAVATLCYYMQPVLLIVLTPFVLKQKLSVKKILCVPAALVGMVLVSGVLFGKQEVSLTGVTLGLCAAVFYTAAVIINRFLKDISSYDATLVQLFVAALVITPYNIFAGVAPTGIFDVKAVIMLVVVGFLHTGLTYYLYFSSIKALPSETVAIYSYIDPAFAILLSIFFLHEPMTVTGVVGAVLILGACIFSEIEFNKRRRG